MIDIKTIEQINNIYNTFGRDPQQKKLVEECRELIDAINQFYAEQPAFRNNFNVAQEIADLFILTAQFYFNHKQVRDIVNYKLHRTEERIKSGYYKR